MCTGDLVSVTNLNTAQTSAGRDTNFTLNIITYDVIVLTFRELEQNHHYSITLRAGNAAGSALSNTTISETHLHIIISLHAMVDDCCNAGTHDIMDVLVNSNGNTIEVVVTFFAESTARGAVMNCVSVNDSGEINITSSVLLTLERINSTAITSFNLYPGQYQVFVYDIEQDGTLSSGVGYPAVTDQLLVSGNRNGG